MHAPAAVIGTLSIPQKTGVVTVPHPKTGSAKGNVDQYFETGRLKIGGAMTNYLCGNS
jgi:hypothetical protein